MRIRMHVLHHLRRSWAEDVGFHYEVADRRIPGGLKCRANPSLIAAFVFRASGTTSGAAHVFFRWLGLYFFSSDIAEGVVFEGAIDLPHPTGIVLGKGVVVGDRTRIFQHVTIGASRDGHYPHIGSNVTLFTGAVVAGGVRIGEGAVIGANCVVTEDVPARSTIRFGSK